MLNFLQLLVFSAGLAAAPIAAGAVAWAVAGTAALATAATTTALVAGTATAATVGIAGGIFGAALAAIGASVFKRQYDKKAAKWEREANLEKFKFTYLSPALS